MKHKNVIIPQYDVPDGLTPLEVQVIVNEKISNKSISAELIYLANKGYIKIDQEYPVLELHKDFLNSKKDYKFTFLKYPDDSLPIFDKEILSMIFGPKSEIPNIVYFSDLNFRFQNSIYKIKKQVEDTLIQNNYYKSFLNLMFVRTEKGVYMNEYLLGLKEYLQIAEKDRIKFHNSPNKRPEVFEKLLPFAIVLGVENLWAKEFEDVYNTPPSRYTG